MSIFPLSIALLMKTEVRCSHLDVPLNQVKLGRSKSLNTPRTAHGMNLRPKRTYSLPNRERGGLPVVQINTSDLQDQFEEDFYTDREQNRYPNYSVTTGVYSSETGE